MFKRVFKQHSICVQRFVQKAFANPSSFYGRKHALVHKSFATLPFCTNSLRGRCALNKKTPLKMGFAEVRRIQQFLWFRFSKGTNAELKLRVALCNTGLWCFKGEQVDVKKSQSCQRLNRNWRFCHRIFWWKTPSRQCWNLQTLKVPSTQTL